MKSCGVCLIINILHHLKYTIVCEKKKEEKPKSDYKILMPFVGNHFSRAAATLTYIQCVSVEGVQLAV